MNEVKEYTIEISENYLDLIDKINYNINQGWQPVGGVAMATFVNNKGVAIGTLAQAMVKY